MIALTGARAGTFPRARRCELFGYREIALGREVRYTYEWTDTNEDGTPNSGDTFTLIGAGP